MSTKTKDETKNGQDTHKGTALKPLAPNSNDKKSDTQKDKSPSKRKRYIAFTVFGVIIISIVTAIVIFTVMKRKETATSRFTEFYLI